MTSTLDALKEDSLSLLQRLGNHEVGLGRLDLSDQEHELPLSAKETKLLELWDSLEQLRLQSAILNAQNNSQPDSSVETTEEQIKVAEEEMLNAKAVYSIRQRIKESVIITDPIIRAVHFEAEASSAEQKLMPLVNRRDALSITHTNVSNNMSQTLSALTTAEVENIKIHKHNAEQARILLDRIAESRAQLNTDMQDPKIQSQIEKLRQEVRNNRLKMRLIKGVVSATIAGSGVDWAHNEELRDLVMDDEQDPDDETI